MIRTISKLLNLPAILRLRFYPAINRSLLRAQGALLGRNVQLVGKIYLTNGGGKTKIGDDFYYSSGEGVNPISGNLRGAIYLEQGASLTIGRRVGMSSTRIWCSDSITIGDHVKIGACVLITDTDAHPMDYQVRRNSNEGTQMAPIVIEDDVWIGAHAIILKGVTIGARSIIGAGSVVTKSIPADCVAAGNPCRVIRAL